MIKSWKNYKPVSIKKTNTLKSEKIIFISNSISKIKKSTKELLEPWQQKLIGTESEFRTKKNNISIIHLNTKDIDDIRNKVGEVFVPLFTKNQNFDLVLLDKDNAQQIITTLEIAKYRFLNLKQTLLINVKTEITQKEIEKSRILGESVNLSRFLVDLPSFEKTPIKLANFLKKLFEKTPSLKTEHITDKELTKLGVGLLLGVGKGAKEKAQLMHFSYRPKTKTKEVSVFIGKGITFDSGGLDIKPSSAMRNMKKDMGGASTVLGLLYFATKAKIGSNIDVITPLAENSVDGESMRPGDILTAMNGKTVEIHNTDAEGRLALADAITYAQKKVKGKIAHIIDVATLTGAIKVGLGSEVPGLFSNNKNLANKLFDVSVKTGEFVWEMPLLKNMRPKIKGTISDLVNCSDGFGGAITAALFLEDFVSEDIAWAHLDIYSWVDSPKGPFSEKGGRGQSIEMLASFID